jgi:hypothetical protein
MRHLKSCARVLLPAACAALVAAPASAAGYEVVLVGGARVVATSRPLVAMGKVSFLDEGRRPVSLPSTVVDVEATRARLGSAQPAGKVWDEKALRRDASRIQFYGEGGAVAAEPETDSGADVAPTSDLARNAGDMSPAERLRAEIDGLNGKIRVLPTSDRTRSMLVIRQLELQQELTRVLTTPAERG